jgi:hypothetical protein
VRNVSASTLPRFYKNSMDRRHQEQFSVEQPPPRDFPIPAVFPAQTHQDMSAPPPYPPGPNAPPHPSFPTMNAPPPSGYRIPLGPGQPFPQGLQAGPPPFRDLDGSPVFIGSALMTNPDSVHPCKIVPGFGAGAARVPYGGTETGAWPRSGAGASEPLTASAQSIAAATMCCRSSLNRWSGSARAADASRPVAGQWRYASSLSQAQAA